jgi:hypothetical protein
LVSILVANLLLNIKKCLKVQKKKIFMQNRSYIVLLGGLQEKKKKKNVTPVMMLYNEHDLIKRKQFILSFFK